MFALSSERRSIFLTNCSWRSFRKIHLNPRSIFGMHSRLGSAGLSVSLEHSRGLGINNLATGRRKGGRYFNLFHYQFFTFLLFFILPLFSFLFSRLREVGGESTRTLSIMNGVNTGYEHDTYLRLCVKNTVKHFSLR